MSKPATVEYPETPELDKEQAHKDEALVLGQFVEWLQEEQGHLDVENFETLDLKLPDILYEYLGIDMGKCETERREVLAYCRTQHSLDDHRKSLGLGERDA